MLDRAVREPYVPSADGPLEVDWKPPPGWRHPVSGRQWAEPDLALIRLGLHFRRARYIAGRSQQTVADGAHIPQSQVSKFERALAPSMDVERLAWLGEALGPAFPLGFCPHPHACPWQPIRPQTPSLVPEDDRKRARFLDELGRRIAGEIKAPSDDEEVDFLSEL